MEHDYLAKEEIITNIAKRDFETIIKVFESNPEAHFWVKNLPEKIKSYEDVRKLLAKTGLFFKPFLIQAFSENDPNGEKTQSGLNELIKGCGVTISGIRKHMGNMTVRELIGNNKQDLLLEIDLTDDNTLETRTVIGTQKYTHKKECQTVLHWRSRKTHTAWGTTADLRLILATLFIIKTVKERLNAISKMETEERNNDALYANAVEYSNILRSILLIKDQQYDDNYICRRFKNWSSFASSTFLLQKDVKPGSNADISRQIYESIGIKVEQTD